jgi:hypothetical protein
LMPAKPRKETIAPLMETSSSLTQLGLLRGVAGLIESGNVR